MSLALLLLLRLHFTVLQRKGHGISHYRLSQHDSVHCSELGFYRNAEQRLVLIAPCGTGVTNPPVLFCSDLMSTLELSLVQLSFVQTRRRRDGATERDAVPRRVVLYNAVQCCAIYEGSRSLVQCHAVERQANTGRLQCSR